MTIDLLKQTALDKKSSLLNKLLCLALKPCSHPVASQDMAIMIIDYAMCVAYCRTMFSFDPSDVKKVSHSISTDSLDKAMEDPVLPQSHAPVPSTSEVSIRRRKTDRERRYSAPPSERRNTRDSVGSLDYLSESQGKYSSGWSLWDEFG